MEEQKIKNLIKGWYENKTKLKSDPFFKFLCLWICFNAWLDYCSGKNSDGEMIKWLVVQTPENSDLIAEYEHAKETELFKKSLERLVAGSPVEDSRGSRSSVIIQDANDRKNIIRAIYKIRCNLFHGGKNSNDQRDKKLVMDAGEILEKWISNLISSWKNKK